MKKAALTGIILAGGKSRRMGKDKGLIIFKGKPFIKYIIEALQPLVNEIVIVSDDEAYDVFMETTRIPDRIPVSGPLGGIYTGLDYIKTPYAIVLSCDIPKIKTDSLEKLTRHITIENDVVQYEYDGETMPLIAVYKKECKITCLSLLEKDKRRVRSLIDELQVKTIQVPESIKDQVININTPEELKLAAYEFEN
ncbi:molybdenum cofactor guanylyltransferase [Aquimarina rhabdastrellae]